MLVGDIVIINFDNKEFINKINNQDPVLWLLVKFERDFLRLILNGTHQNLWKIQEHIDNNIYGNQISRREWLRPGLIDHSWIIHIPTKFVMPMKRDYLMTMSMIRDKKIDKLLC